MKALVILSLLLYSIVSFGQEAFQKKLQEELILAEPGSVIHLPEGNFTLTAALSLMTDEVLIKGKGMNKTILSFKNQKTGAEGFTVNASGVTFEDLTIQDTKGDGIKVTKSKDLTIRRVKIEWTGGPKKTNGGYGLYPVQCKNVLIEDSEVVGASDAGIYVGQSKNIVVRRNYVHENVAGIEIENSIGADVYDNMAFNNTGGILVFDMPGLSLYGSKTRVFNNRVISNNLDNFAPAENVVGLTPPGTGIMVLSTDQVEIFGNEIKDNQTAGIIITNYGVTEKPIDDEKYDLFPEGLFIYDNTFVGGGENPKGGSSEMSQTIIGILKNALPLPFPHIIYDGAVNPLKTKEGQIPSELKLCIQESKEVKFVNLDLPNSMEGLTFDRAAHSCTHPKLTPIKF